MRIRTTKTQTGSDPGSAASKRDINEFGLASTAADASTTTNKKRRGTPISTNLKTAWFVRECERALPVQQ
jgi:hypothetical protein